MPGKWLMCLLILAIAAGASRVWPQPSFNVAMVRESWGVSAVLPVGRAVLRAEASGRGLSLQALRLALLNV